MACVCVGVRVYTQEFVCMFAFCACVCASRCGMRRPFCRNKNTCYGERQAADAAVAAMGSRSVQ